MSDDAAPAHATGSDSEGKMEQATERGVLTRVAFSRTLSGYSGVATVCIDGKPIGDVGSLREALAASPVTDRESDHGEGKCVPWAEAVTETAALGTARSDGGEADEREALAKTWATIRFLESTNGKISAHDAALHIRAALARLRVVGRDAEMSGGAVSRADAAPPDLRTCGEDWTDTENFCILDKGHVGNCVVDPVSVVVPAPQDLLERVADFIDGRADEVDGPKAESRRSLAADVRALRASGAASDAGKTEKTT